jgi:uncharacterized membrane protein (UPF0127 family)
LHFILYSSKVEDESQRRSFDSKDFMKAVSIRLKNGPLVAENAWMTEDVTEKDEGWLKKQESKSGDGLLIAPCSAIHTFGMKIIIDAVFLDAHMKITRLHRSLEPNRVATGSVANLLMAWNSQVLELPEGASRDLKAGDHLELLSREPESR